MKKYIKPVSAVVLVKIGNILNDTSLGFNRDSNVDASSVDAKNGMTPVSEDNANSIWED